MSTNLSSQNFTVTKEQFSAFELQSSLFKIHRDQIYIDTNIVNGNSQSKQHHAFDNLKKDYSAVFEQLETEFFQKKGIEERQLKAISPEVVNGKKQKLITDQEAEDFLLKTIFTQNK